jgi:hypothetical protein
MKETEFLFVCGCPRSGTSAITQLLNSHESIGIGMERFKNYIKPDSIQKFQSSLFERDRFFDFRHGDTNRVPNNSNPTLEKFYNRIQEKWDLPGQKLYVGDKIPFLYRFYNHMESGFAQAKIIFMLRNVFEVARSFQNRYNDPDDAWRLDYRDGVRNWNHSLEQTEEALRRKKLDIMISPYQEIFSGEHTAVHRIASFLTLEATASLLTKYDELTINWRPRVSGAELPDEFLEYIEENADMQRYSRLLSNHGTRNQ